MFFTVANAIEAVLWFGIALTIFVRTGRAGKDRQGIALTVSVAFFWFGISDLVEITTGAWWRSVWLLLLKMGCVLTLLECLRRHLASRRASPPPPPPPDLS